MIRAQRRVHRTLWKLLFPLLLALFAYAVIRGYEQGPQAPPAALEHGATHQHAADEAGAADPQRAALQPGAADPRGAR